MDILIVCNNLKQATRLYHKFVSIFRRDSIAFAGDNLRVRLSDYNIHFITKDRLDICERGRHDVEVVRAADLEAWLDKHCKGE